MENRFVEAIEYASRISIGITIYATKEGPIITGFNPRTGMQKHHIVSWHTLRTAQGNPLITGIDQVAEGVHCDRKQDTPSG